MVYYESSVPVMVTCHSYVSTEILDNKVAGM